MTSKSASLPAGRVQTGITAPVEDDAQIRPFLLDVPQARLDDLRQRVLDARLPPEVPGLGWRRGVPGDVLAPLVERWRDGYDWQSQQDRINAIPQFTTTIDGAGVHFFHVRSPEPHARALILTHGWPSTPVEFFDVLGPLTDPRAHGLDPAQAFHVVAPAVPNFPFSGPTADAGWTSTRIARTWATLMARLGYGEYLAHGGDIGSSIARDLAMLDPAHALGAHVLQVWSFPSGDEEEMARLSEDDFTRLAEAEHFADEYAGYMELQQRRPGTLAYALSDSPVAQLAWIVDFAEAFGDNPGAYDADGLLTTATLYWLSDTGGAAAQLYYEDTHPPRDEVVCHRPIGVLVFPGDFRSIRPLAERDNPNIVRWTEAQSGGHFGALMEPGLFVEELRAFDKRLQVPSLS